MNKQILLSLLLFFASAKAWQQDLPITKGTRITKSIKVKKHTYQLVADTGIKRAVIIVEGDDLVIDFNDAVLDGTNSRKPDEFTGVAVLVQNSHNVTIRNLHVSGYKIGLLARGVSGLVLENCNLSYNYRQHLNSSQEKEDISDWMSYHQNEQDEWLRYGAAVYLRGCDRAVITQCRVTGGQNALMMMECNEAMVYNNDFSFNSGIGIGMYRCSRNKILYNRIIFNVRGYSHGVYNRGQDSAGILVYEQSSNNLFYKNAVTHGGDGFFLWAGQTTMDSGQGGCNDNVLFQNDFSYAPTNGVEVTFSRNRIQDNRIYECDHGIWGGYSFESTIAGNRFRNNRIGIAIEHGQDNDIYNNLFYGEKEAIRLWSRKSEPSDWGYAKTRDTRSRDYHVVLNSFNNNQTALFVTGTDRVAFFGNTFNNCQLDLDADETVTGLIKEDDDTLSEELEREFRVDTPVLRNPVDPFRNLGNLAGRKNIWVTAWGPYDFRYPIIWNTNPTDTSGSMNFELKGPHGKWKVKSIRGVRSLSRKKGSFPSGLTAEKNPGSKVDIDIELEYRGDSFTDQFGRAVKKKQRFHFRKFFQPVDWTVSWYRLDTFHLRSDPQAIEYATGAEPVKQEKTDRLDYAWWGGIDAGTRLPQFETRATGEGYFEKGPYELNVTWDDMVRVYVDDSLVVDEWNPSLYTFDESPHKKVLLTLSGMHTFRVEHRELGGFATLSVQFRKPD